MTSSLNKFGLIVLGLLMVAGATYFFLRKDQPKLYINEFMAFNTLCCPDTIAKVTEFEDWIEIYNAGSVAVDIGGMYFSQSADIRLAFQIPKKNPELTNIQPGGFLLLWADGDPGRGTLHLNFKLDQDGEFIGLYHEDGRTVDSITFAEQKENVSFGRTSDGDETWKEFSIPTPGTTNR